MAWPVLLMVWFHCILFDFHKNEDFCNYGIFHNVSIFKINIIFYNNFWSVLRRFSLESDWPYLLIEWITLCFEYDIQSYCFILFDRSSHYLIWVGCSIILSYSIWPLNILGWNQSVIKFMISFFEWCGWKTVWKLHAIMESFLVCSSFRFIIILDVYCTLDHIHLFVYKF